MHDRNRDAAVFCDATGNTDLIVAGGHFAAGNLNGQTRAAFAGSLGCGDADRPEPIEWSLRRRLRFEPSGARAHEKSGSRAGFSKLQQNECPSRQRLRGAEMGL